MNFPAISPYAWLMIVGILGSAAAWAWMFRAKRETTGRLLIVYCGALLGALIGAKLAFLIAEGWHYRDNMIALLSGRSITGGLLGGYAGVEITKKILGITGTTGDRFALIVPAALAIGRVGCLLQKCCPGVPCTPAWWTIVDAHGDHRWPAALVEFAFNIVFFLWAMLATRFNWLPGNRFHMYLIAYGVFRFAHEFARANVNWFGGISGYHLLAIAMVVLGAVRMWQRNRGNICLVPAG
ncbi:MAG: prolipoprotein diacylglyceryl transferase [Phycisphaerae bacterium]